MDKKIKYATYIAFFGFGFYFGTTILKIILNKFMWYEFIAMSLFLTITVLLLRHIDELFSTKIEYLRKAIFAKKIVLARREQ